MAKFFNFVLFPKRAVGDPPIALISLKTAQLAFMALVGWLVWDYRDDVASLKADVASIKSWQTGSDPTSLSYLLQQQEKRQAERDRRYQASFATMASNFNKAVSGTDRLAKEYVMPMREDVAGLKTSIDALNSNVKLLLAK